MSKGTKTYGKSPSYYAWQRLKKNRNAFLSLIFIFICAIIAIGGYLFLPDSTPDANKQNLELELLPPLSKVTILEVPKKEMAPQKNIISYLISGQKEQYDEVAIKSYRTDKNNIIVKPFDGDKEESYPQTQTKIINRTYWLGTDRYGRDMLSRLLLGTRISFAVGLISVIISLLIGVTLGAMAGFFRGWADHFILWLMNVVWAIPTFLLVMAVSLVLGKGFWQVFCSCRINNVGRGGKTGSRTNLECPRARLCDCCESLRFRKFAHYYHAYFAEYFRACIGYCGS